MFLSQLPSKVYTFPSYSGEAKAPLPIAPHSSRKIHEQETFVQKLLRGPREPNAERICHVFLTNISKIPTKRGAGLGNVESIGAPRSKRNIEKQMLPISTSSSSKNHLHYL